MILLVIAVSHKMTIKGGTNKACAACKYQRRRCSKECPLSPYFPADQPKKFSNAHRLFGVCNIMRILNHVEPDQRDEAMESIIFESDMREKYPVHGCFAVVWNYQNQTLKLLEELRYVKMLLSLYKENCQYHHLPYQMPPSPSECSLLSQQQLQFAMPGGGDALPFYNHLQEFSLFDGVNGIHNGVAYIQSEDNLMKTWCNQQAYCNGITDFNIKAMASQYNHQELDIPSDYDEIPFDAIADDRQSFVECKEACESSAESPFKDATQHIENVSNNELKSAAACFSLTSVKG